MNDCTLFPVKKLFKLYYQNHQLMKEIVFEELGLPEEVLQLKESDKPEPKAHEVQIQVKARNINPSDLMFIQGRYGITPQLPSSAGFEASGIVSKSDAEGKIPEGTKVMFSTLGTWREYLTMPAASVIPIPEGMSFEVACQAFVNPITAVTMVKRAEMKPGDWLLITAGASAFGKFAIQVAKEKGIKVACTVRHDAQKEYLKKVGTDLVINTELESLGKVIKEQIPEGVAVVFDAVGGELGAKALNCLKKQGKMFVFGALSMNPIPLNSGTLIFKEITIVGFWLSSELERVKGEERSALFKETISLLMKSDFQTDVAETYDLSNFKLAIEKYNELGRNGKIILTS